jgi:predicted GH43/DUF377 family glycosyl hydrolase
VENQSEPNVFLYRHGKLSIIPDKESLDFLGVKEDAIERVSFMSFLEKTKHFEFTGTLESMKLQVFNPDEIMRIYSAKFRTLQDNDNLLSNLKKIENVWNPSVEYWRSDYLVAARTPLGSLIKFGWLNISESDHLSFSEYSKFGIGPKLEDITNQTQRYSLYGNDPRILIVNDTQLLISFCITLFPRTPSRMAYVYITVNSSGSTSVSPMRLLDPTFQDPGISARAYSNSPHHQTFHKNWTPFLYNGTVLWLASLDPLIVVKSNSSAYRPDINAHADSTILISESMPHGYWNEYGDLRGGSVGKLISADKYLFFFHSRQKLGTNTGFNAEFTYMMGAFVMSAQPPFRMLAISKGPIFNKEFYVGAWDIIKFMDYVVYPMSFFFDSGIHHIDYDCDMRCMSAHNITLSLGYQDHLGIVATINLGELVHTMVPLNTSATLSPNIEYISSRPRSLRGLHKMHSK